jgi:DNA-entry nuclease
MGKRGLVLALAALLAVALVVAFLVGRGPKDHASSRASLASEQPSSSEANTSALPAAARSDTVYATRTGKRYHRAACRSLSKSAIPMTRAEAEAKGLTPCKVCKP